MERSGLWLPQPIPAPTCLHAGAPHAGSVGLGGLLAEAHQSQTPRVASRLALLLAAGTKPVSGWLVLEVTGVLGVSRSGTGCPQPRRLMASK